jgi:hypothetical protein
MAIKAERKGENKYCIGSHEGTNKRRKEKVRFFLGP